MMEMFKKDDVISLVKAKLNAYTKMYEVAQFRSFEISREAEAKVAAANDILNLLRGDKIKTYRIGSERNKYSGNQENKKEENE